jgi:hypothetical protein
MRELRPEQARKDSYVFISHSRGSRILIDAWQTVTASLAVEGKDEKVSANVADWRRALQEKKLTIFMLSNQLPLLQLGREPPVVTDQNHRVLRSERHPELGRAGRGARRLRRRPARHQADG